MHIVNEFERELASFHGLQLIERREPHVWFDLYFYGSHITGTASEQLAWAEYYRKLSG